MRKYHWFILLCFGVTVTSAAPETDVVVTISDEGSSINNVEFILSPPIRKLIALWGQPDRVSSLENDVRVWDRLGVRSYSAPGTTFADSLTFTMKKKDSKLSAKEVFTGKIKLASATITRESTAADLLKHGFTRDATFEKYYRKELLAASFFVEVDPTDGALVELSVTFEL